MYIINFIYLHLAAFWSGLLKYSSLSFFFTLFLLLLLKILQLLLFFSTDPKYLPKMLSTGVSHNYEYIPRYSNSFQQIDSE